MKTSTKILLILTCSILYIIALTAIFEYGINEASSTLITAGGILVIILLTWLLAVIILKLRKK